MTDSDSDAANLATTFCASRKLGFAGYDQSLNYPDIIYVYGVNDFAVVEIWSVSKVVSENPTERLFCMAPGYEQSVPVFVIDEIRRGIEHVKVHPSEAALYTYDDEQQR